MPIVKYSLDQTKEIVDRVQRKVRKGKTISEACKEEDVNRAWYYSSIKRIKRKEQSLLQYYQVKNRRKEMGLGVSGDSHMILGELEKMSVPNRVIVPVSVVNYLYLEKKAIDCNIDISNVAAFLLNEKINEDMQTEQDRSIKGQRKKAQTLQTK